MGVHHGDGRKSATFQEKAKLEAAASTVAAEVSLTLCLWWHRLSGHTLGGLVLWVRDLGPLRTACPEERQMEPRSDAVSSSPS